MSKQSGNFPDEPEVPIHKQAKKKKGKYELWMRHNLTDGSRNWFGWEKWHKLRTYPTFELAEKNRLDYNRKWNGPYPNGIGPWEFEIREKME